MSRPFRKFEGLPLEVAELVDAAAAARTDGTAKSYQRLWAAVETLREPPPKRYVVEVRPPKKGERYRWNGSVETSSVDSQHERDVIVAEDPS